MEKSLRLGCRGGSMTEQTISNKPRVSVIVPFLNAEKFFEETIESVFTQTYDNWELLLVDDGSIDQSTAIALRYAEHYPGKVRYLQHDNHQNRGKSISRNLGISNAKGEYIAFLDADDVWLPPKLEKQVALLDLQPETAMVCGSTQLWYSWTGNREDIERDYMREIGVQPNTLFQPPTLLSLLLRHQANPPATCSVLLRRKVIEEIGGFEETIQHIYEDQVFFAKLYLKMPVFVENGCWDRYRQHPDSCCAVAARTGQFDYVNPNPAQLTFLNWVAEYLSQQKVKEPEVWKALQKGLWPYRYPILYQLLRPRHFVKLIGRWILPVPVRRWLRVQYKDKPKRSLLALVELW